MKQLSLDEVPLARTSDPETSHQAAERSSAFRATHEARILATLEKFGPGGGTVHEIGAYAGLDYVAVARRMRRLEEIGAAERTGKTRHTPSGGRACVWALGGQGGDQ